MQIPYLGLEEITKDKGLFAKQIAAEFIGTLILVLFSCGSATGSNAVGDEQGQVVRIALCFGLIVASLAQVLGHVSGCHINPAVTIGLVTGGKVGVVKGLVYTVVQILGGVAGAGVLRGLVSENLRGGDGLGATTLARNVTPAQGFGVELFITMMVVLTVFAAAADEYNAVNVKGSAPLAIGLAVAAGHLFAIPLTGSGMNPARSLGPAIMVGSFANHWVYWVGPLLGGVIAGIIYQTVLKAPSPKVGY